MKTISTFFAEWKEELDILLPLAGIYAAFFFGPALKLDFDTRTTLLMWVWICVLGAMFVRQLLEVITKAAKKKIDEKHQTDSPGG